MRKRIATAAALALLAVSFGGVMRTATAESPAATTEILVVLPHDAQVATFLDFAEDGLTQGDRAVLRAPLVDPVERRQVGRVKGECVAVSDRIKERSGLWRCSYLLELPAGNLIIEGLDPRGPGSSKFAVLGGTEGYRTAAGDADLVDKPGRTEMHLHVEV